MAASGQTLEALVRDELRGPVSELVRQVVVELVREQLNGSAEPSTNGTATPALRHCNGCDRDLPTDAFSPRHYRCRECRNRANRAREERDADAEEPPRPGDGP